MSETVIVMGEPGKRTVEEASQWLKRLYWVERETMRTLGGYLVSVSNWELKKKIPRHMWQDSLRADALRTRILEMRYPRRDVDQGHHPLLKSYLSSLIKCRNDAELVSGVYFVTKKALYEAYEAYLQGADPLDDAPTVAFMKHFGPQLKEQLEEIAEIYGSLPEKSASGEWQSALEQYMNAIGGLMEATAPVEERELLLPSVLMRDDYTPPLVPARDPRFEKAHYHMPPRSYTKFIEHQVWQGINHVNEIWASEVPGLAMWRWNDMPWEFYLDSARWAYDEARHCMMGEERLKAWGFEAGVDYPVFGDHYASVSEQGELALLVLLHAFETGGPKWKSGLKQHFEAKGDTASSQDFDYDWADESIHLHYGHKWTLHRLGGDADDLEDYKAQLMECWNRWIEAANKRWDYEPFMGRIEHKIAELEAGRHE